MRSRSIACRRSSTQGKPNQVDALVDIDLTVEPGEFVSLIGPSGCGKSTLLRLIANLIEPTSGDSSVNGKPAAQARLDQDYGMAFQQAGLFDWRTVEKNIELPLELKGWDKAKRRARAQEMLELVKLPEFGRHMPWQLSGGMQQRIAIATRARCPPAAAADGRAVRRPRRDDARAHAGRAAPDLRRDRRRRSCSSPTRSPKRCTCPIVWS